MLLLLLFAAFVVVNVVVVNDDVDVVIAGVGVVVAIIDVKSKHLESNRFSQ